VPGSKEKLVRCIGRKHACHVELLVERFNENDGGYGQPIELLVDGDHVREAIEQLEQWLQLLRGGQCDACDGDRYFHSSCVGRDCSLADINTLVNFCKERKRASLQHRKNYAPTATRSTAWSTCLPGSSVGSTFQCTLCADC
jgi:hypothetical protein